jgi:Flp pilus assembly protein TadG
MSRPRQIPAKGASAALRQFGRDDRGGAAVEFALLGSTFLLLVCMILELGLLLFTQSVLNDAVRDGARLIRLGQADTSAIFVAKVCAKAGPLVPSCTTSLKYKVQAADTFNALSATTALANQYDSGASGQSVIVQIGYSRLTLVPWTSSYLLGTNLLVSTVALQNDPY